MENVLNVAKKQIQNVMNLKTGKWMAKLIKWKWMWW